MPIRLSLGSWKIWLIVIIIIFIILWIFIGGRNDITPMYPNDVLPGLCGPPPIIEKENIRATPIVRPGRSKSENMASEVFSDIIQRYGGDINNIQYNIRLPEIINPETGRRLELDAYYDDGCRKIAMEYQGQQHLVFPNNFHPNTEKGRKDFDAQLRRDQYKLEACVRNNICLIRIPYTIDTCDINTSNYNPKIPPQERRERLYEFIRMGINSCIQDRQ